MKNRKKKLIASLIAVLLLGTAFYMFFDRRDLNDEDNVIIKIGLLTSLTGSNSRGGASMKNSVELAVNQINKSGGINGAKLELVIYDDQGEPTLTEKRTKDLIFLDNVEAIIGPYSSECCLAIASLVNICEAPLFTPVTIADEIMREEGYVFRNTLSISAAQSKMNGFLSNSDAYVLLEGFGAKTIGILWQNDVWGKNMLEQIKSDLSARNKEDAILFDETFLIGQNDFSYLFQRHEEKFPDLIYVISSGKEAEQIVRAGKEIGFKGLFYGESGFNMPEFDTNLKEYADGCLFATQWHPSFSTPMSDVFLRSYMKEYETPPDMFSAISYESVYILKDSLERVYSSLWRDDFRSVLHADLLKPGKIEGVTGAIFFSDGQCDRPLFILQKRWDGKNVQSFIVYPLRYSQSDIKWSFELPSEL
jgi:branched-chain amino acid transport system substrate-binding protein